MPKPLKHWPHNISGNTPLRWERDSRQEVTQKGGTGCGGYKDDDDDDDGKGG